MIEQASDDRQALLDFLESARTEKVAWADILKRVTRCLDGLFDHFNWTGVYLVDGDELVLGPYVGAPTDHVRIPIGRGICGAAAATGRTIVVDDVRADPRYLACFLTTRSEIVVPFRAGGDPAGAVIGEIDVDSDTLGAFGPADADFLEAVATHLGRLAPAGTAYLLPAEV